MICSWPAMPSAVLPSDAASSVAGSLEGTGSLGIRIKAGYSETT
jgi:hypothetical protein